LKVADNGQNECECGDPDRSPHSTTSRSIGGWFLLVLGFALLSTAFHVADEPRPPPITKCLYVACGFCAFACFAQGIILIGT
jgi:hypothetical protein